MTPTEPRPLTDEQALYLAVLSATWEDGPRLMMADYWEEHGQAERAEFVRTQCEVAKIDPTGIGKCDGSPDDFRDGQCEGTTCKLRRREQELWVDNCLEWFKNIRPFCCPSLARDRLTEQSMHGFPVRGFIGLLSCSWSDWLAHHETLYYHPWQRVECPAVSYNPTHYGCTKCSASGTIPRPIMEKRKCGRCGGDGWGRKELREAVSPMAILDGCTACGGSGSALANVLDTAQPIQRVIITDDPNRREMLNRTDPGKNEYTCERWPIITFHLPETA